MEEVFNSPIFLFVGIYFFVGIFGFKESVFLVLGLGSIFYGLYLGTFTSIASGIVISMIISFLYAIFFDDHQEFIDEP